MNLINTRPGCLSFIDYFKKQCLPAHRAEVRDSQIPGVKMALIEHASMSGNEFDPLNELTISIVLRSNYEPAVRDQGYGENRFTITPSQILLTPPDRGSYWWMEGRPLILHLGMPLHYVENVLDAKRDVVENEISRAARMVHNDPLIGQMASRLWSSGYRSSRYGGRFAQRCLDSIITLLLDTESVDQLDEGTAALAPWRLHKVMDALANPQPGLTVADLARLVDLSPDYFSRAFKSATGRSPHQVLSETRIEQAKTMLCNTSRSMTEIALELGFSSSAHFSSRFRQLTGLSPREWKTSLSVSGKRKTGENTDAPMRQ